MISPWVDASETSLQHQKDIDKAKMIRRFVCLVLVVVMLANQGLFVAHSHHAAEGSEPDRHASRPHFHLGDQSKPHAVDHDTTDSHTHHSDCDRRTGDHERGLPPSVASLGDHDADAVYFAGAVTLVRDGVSPNVHPAKFIALVAMLGVADECNDKLLRLGPIRGQPSSVFDAACPLYLRTLSLRI